MLGSASTCHWKPTSVRVQQTELASDGNLGLGKMAGLVAYLQSPCTAAFATKAVRVVPEDSSPNSGM